MSILFINASPNKNGNTAKLAKELLVGKEYETLNLIDYKIYAYGQEYVDDQFDEVIQRIKAADTVVMGSPLYWHNICGLMRNFLDRCYGPIGQGEFSGGICISSCRGLPRKSGCLRPVNSPCPVLPDCMALHIREWLRTRRRQRH